METHESLFHAIAADICNKPPEMTDATCFSQRTKSLCRDYERCRLYEKTLEQLKYVQQSIGEDVFLSACPGSGKTEVVGLKAAHEIKAWRYPSKGIAVLTFTNNAANEIKERITQFAGVGGTAYPHFIGTIDSWLHGYVANPFAHMLTGYLGKEDGNRSLRIIESGYQADWLNSFVASTKYILSETKMLPIYANAYYLDVETRQFCIQQLNSSRWITHTALYKTNSFEKFRSDKPWLTEKKFFKSLEENKEKFWKAGYCTYEDIEYIVYSILYDNKYQIADLLSKRFPLIIIDECQDLSWMQLKIMKKMKIKGSVLHFVGDLNQGIYSFKKVFPQKVEEFVAENSLVKISLDRNFRSAQQIVDLCGKLCDQGTIVACPKNEEKRYPACVLFTYSPEELSDLPRRFLQYLKKYQLDESKSAILARGKKMIARLEGVSNETNSSIAELPMRAIFLWQVGDGYRQRMALQDMGKYIAIIYFKENAVDRKNQFCPESLASRIQWRVFLASVLKACARFSKLVDQNLLWSQWSKEFRESFPKIISENAEKCEIDLNDKDFRFKCPKGKASKKLVNCLAEILGRARSARIRITTIHQVKGETHDATLLVSSSSKGQGGHWSEWLDSSVDEGEPARFAYVASSRPKNLLAWAIPENDEVGIKKLQELGFFLEKKDVEG